MRRTDEMSEAVARKHIVTQSDLTHFRAVHRSSPRPIRLASPPWTHAPRRAVRAPAQNIQRNVRRLKRIASANGGNERDKQKRAHCKTHDEKRTRGGAALF